MNHFEGNVYGRIWPGLSSPKKHCAVSDTFADDDDTDKRMVEEIRALFMQRSDRNSKSVDASSYIVKSVPKRKPKATKSRQNVLDDDDGDGNEDDDDSGDENEENPLLQEDQPSEDTSNRMTLTIETNSLRLDGFAKSAFGVSRANIEEHFYKGDIYINGQRPPKKSEDLRQGDEVDIVKFTDPEDHNLVQIKRVRLDKVPEKAMSSGRIRVQITRWQSLTVKPYNTEADE